MMSRNDGDSLASAELARRRDWEKEAKEGEEVPVLLDRDRRYVEFKGVRGSRWDRKADSLKLGMRCLGCEDRVRGLSRWFPPPGKNVESLRKRGNGAWDGEFPFDLRT